MRLTTRVGMTSLLAALVTLLVPGAELGAEEKRPQLLLPLGHTGGVTSVAWSPDGKWVLTGSGDKTARIWDVPSGKSLLVLVGHAGTINTVAWSRDGNRVLTGGDDKTVRVWDARTGRGLLTLQGHTGAVRCISVSPDGRHIVSGGIDKIAKLWDAQTGKLLLTFRGHAGIIYCAAFSPDGKSILTGGDSGFGRPGEAKVWDSQKGTELFSLKGHGQYVSSVAFRPDGQRILTGCGDLIAREWDNRTGNQVSSSWMNARGGHLLAYKPDGKQILSCDHKGQVRLWDSQTYKELISIEAHATFVNCVAFSPDGNHIATGSSDSTAKIWDAQSGKAIMSLKSHSAPILGLSNRSDGNQLAVVGREKTARLWDVNPGKGGIILQGHTDSVGSVAFSPDGKHVLTGSRDRTGKVWDTRNGNLVFTISPNYPSEVHTVAYSHDGKQILTGIWDYSPRLWDAQTGKELLRLSGTTPFVAKVAFSPDNRRILAAGYDATKIWDAQTGKQLLNISPSFSQVECVTFSPNGKQILIGLTNGKVQVLNADSGKQLLSIHGHDSSVNAVACSPDGKRILTGSTDNTARCWNAESGKSLFTLKGHTDRVTSVAFRPNGNHILTGSMDGSVRIWNALASKELYAFLFAGDDWLAWTPEGYYHGSPGAEKLIAWKIDDSTAPGGYRIIETDQLRKTFRRPDLFAHLLTEPDLASALVKADRERGGIVTPATTLAKALPPSVVWISPRKDTTLEQETLRVEASAVSAGEHPVRRMRLLVDGSPYRGNLSTFNVSDPRPGEVSRTWTVQLEPGTYSLQVVAENGLTEGRSSTLRITRSARVESLPRLFVLAVGISDYEQEKLRQGVYFCKGDASKFADTLTRSSKPLYRDIQVMRLLDRDATRQKILRALTQIAKQATTRDTVVLFFAGHGKLDEQNNFYFLPSETDLEDLPATGLSEGDFKTRVNTIPGRKVLLLDACHSGALIEANRRSLDGLTDRLWRDLTSTEHGLLVMCSSRGNQVSRESDTFKGGYFTVALVEGLQGKARKVDGAVYFKALDDYVVERVKDLSQGTQHPLTSRDNARIDLPLTKP